MRVIARGESVCGEIALRHGPGPHGQPAYEIILNGVFLMASYNRTSERALAALALEPLAGRSGIRVLIGGLGMGFTLQATLAHSQVAHVDVDQARLHATKYGVMSVPTVLYIKGGEVKAQQVGLTAKDKMVEKIDALL